MHSESAPFSSGDGDGDDYRSTDGYDDSMSVDNKSDDMSVDEKLDDMSISSENLPPPSSDADSSMLIDSDCLHSSNTNIGEMILDFTRISERPAKRIKSTISSVASSSAIATAITSATNAAAVMFASSAAIPSSSAADVASDQELDLPLHPPSPERSPEPLLNANANRYMTIKCSVQATSWNNMYLENLELYVIQANIITRHTYLFLKYNLLLELQQPDFDFRMLFTEQFIAQVWLKMTIYIQRGRLGQPTIALRNRIDNSLQGYLDASGYAPIPFSGGHQVSLYEASSIYTAYINNIKMRFGQHLRRLINHLLAVKIRSRTIRITMQSQVPPATPQAINDAIYNTITDPARKFKVAVASRAFNLDEFLATIDGEPDIFRRAWDILRPIYENGYPAGYHFDYIYYDVKVNPQNHFKALYLMGTVFRDQHLRTFSCFPIRQAWSPRYVTIDTVVLCQKIINLPWHGFNAGYVRQGIRDTRDKNMATWSNVVDLTRKVFLPQETDRPQHRQLRFHGLIKTDGVGVSVAKQRSGTTPQQGGNLGDDARDHPSLRYIHDLTPQEHRAIQGRCVLIDPGRRDILFAMHENSTSRGFQNIINVPGLPRRWTWRYTQSTQAKMRKTRKFRNIVNEWKPNEVRQAEEIMSALNYNTVDMAQFTDLLATRHLFEEELMHFYAHVMTRQSPHAHQYPLFRKLRLDAYMNGKKHDQRLVKDVRDMFRVHDQDPVLVIGNWSAPMTRFHEPLRAVGLRRLLIANGFEVLLIDEFRTSRCCPLCLNDTLRNYVEVPNPRVFRRAQHPTVVCHGLLACTSDECRTTLRNLREGGIVGDRHFNRDLAAVLNMRHILLNLRQHGEVPQRFLRIRHRHPAGPQNPPRNQQHPQVCLGRLPPGSPPPGSPPPGSPPPGSPPPAPFVDDFINDDPIEEGPIDDDPIGDHLTSDESDDDDDSGDSGDF